VPARFPAPGASVEEGHARPPQPLPDVPPYATPNLEPVRRYGVGTSPSASAWSGWPPMRPSDDATAPGFSDRRACREPFVDNGSSRRIPKTT